MGLGWARLSSALTFSVVNLQLTRAHSALRRSLAGGNFGDERV